MKYLVISDIHGVYEYVKKIKEIVDKEKIDKIILLGDLYYHGLNKQLNEESMKIVYLLDKYKDIITCTRGNCDTDTDEIMSDFEFGDYIKLSINGKNFFFTHGHLYNINNLPSDIDVFIYGHLHTGFIKKVKDKLCINSGSISLPRNNTPHTYLIITNENIYLKDIEGKIMDEINYIKS